MFYSQAAVKPKPKKIIARGHTSRVELLVRPKGGSKKEEPALIDASSTPDIELLPGAGTDDYEVKPVDEKDASGEDVEVLLLQTPSVVHSSNFVSQMEEEASSADQHKSPQDAGCEVTHPDKQTGPMLGSYEGLGPLVCVLRDGAATLCLLCLPGNHILRRRTLLRPLL